MAKSILPNALTRREWIEQRLDPQRARRTAEAYLEEGRVAEAIAFLGKAEARERLVEIREEAIGSGDAFLLREACRALGEEPRAEHWSALAEAASAAGKQAYASEARRHLEPTEV